MGIWLDFRYAIRTLARNPVPALLAVLTLALGIGANTAMFSVIRAAFLTRLPFPGEDRLFLLWQRGPDRGYARELVSPANFVDWDAGNSVFEASGAWPAASDAVTAFNVNWGSSSERVRGAYVSSGFFRALGVQPVLGRTFVPDEDRARGHRAAVISHSYWQSRFHGSLDVLGKTIEVDTFRGGVYTIAGVMPPDFDFPPGSEIFLPVAFWGGGPLPPPQAAGRCCAWFSVAGRLKPGIGPREAAAHMSALARRISELHPAGGRVTEIELTPLRAGMIGPHRTGLLVLFGAVVCVLLLASVNVAALALSRSVTRRPEMALRGALGAGRARLVRLVFIENLVPGVLGAASGLLLAVSVLQFLVRALSDSIPLVTRSRLDWAVLAFTAAVTLVSSCICALFPALHLRPASFGSALQGGFRSSTAPFRAGRLQEALMVAEVAIAVALVAVAGLLIRTVLRLQNVDPGFRSENVLAISFDLTSAPFRGPGRQQPRFDELMSAMSRLPGVRGAAAVSEAPLSRASLPDQPVTVEGQPVRSASESPQVLIRAITPDYFPVMGIPLRAGRLFTDGDSSDGRLVAILNETAARRLFNGERPIGRRLALGSAGRFGYFRNAPPPGQPEWRDVAGVVADVRSSALDEPPQPEVFFSYRQFSWYSPVLLLRTGGDPLLLAAAARREAAAVNPHAVITGIRSLEQIADSSIAQPRFRAFLTGLFGALALLLGMLGIYGVISYATAQRTREIGIRMALGASRFDAAWLVAGQALRVTSAGLALGAAIAFAAARFMSGLLFGVSPADPTTLLATIGLFAGSAVAASYIPARRAASVDPAAAVRNQ